MWNAELGNSGPNFAIISLHTDIKVKNDNIMDEEQND